MGEMDRRSFLRGAAVVPLGGVVNGREDLRAALRAKYRHYVERQEWYDRLENMDVESVPEMTELYCQIQELECRILRGDDFDG